MSIKSIFFIIFFFFFINNAFFLYQHFVIIHIQTIISFFFKILILRLLLLLFIIIASIVIAIGWLWVLLRGIKLMLLLLFNKFSKVKKSRIVILLLLLLLLLRLLRRSTLMVSLIKLCDYLIFNLFCAVFQQHCMVSQAMSKMSGSISKLIFKFPRTFWTAFNIFIIKAAYKQMQVKKYVIMVFNYMLKRFIFSCKHIKFFISFLRCLSFTENATSFIGLLNKFTMLFFTQRIMQFAQILLVCVSWSLWWRRLLIIIIM